MNARSLLMCAFLGMLAGCDKPHVVSLVRVTVLEDHSIKVENKRYPGVSEAKAAIRQIEDEQPDTRFTLTATNMSQQEGVDLVRQLSDNDGKMGLVGILTAPGKN